MITEAIITAVFNAMSAFLGRILDAVLSIAGRPDGFQIGFPSNLWFVWEYMSAVVLIVMPLAFGWWIWRGFKA